MTTENVRTSSMHGDAINEIYDFYQPRYSEFHQCRLFVLNRENPEQIDQAVVDEANDILRRMYDSETPEFRQFRLWTQLDSAIYSSVHKTYLEHIKTTRKFHKVFFIRQPELFVSVMNLNNRYVKVNCEKITKDQSVLRQGEFSLELQSQSEYTAKFNGVSSVPRYEQRDPSVKYNAAGDGFEQVTYRKSRDRRSYQNEQGQSYQRGSRDNRDTRDQRDTREREPRDNYRRTYNNRYVENARPYRSRGRDEQYVSTSVSGNVDNTTRQTDRTPDRVERNEQSERLNRNTPPTESEVRDINDLVSKLQTVKVVDRDTAFGVERSGSSWADMDSEEHDKTQ